MRYVINKCYIHFLNDYPPAAQISTCPNSHLREFLLDRIFSCPNYQTKIRKWESSK